MSAVFSSTETAFTALSIIQIRELKEEKSKAAKLAAKLTEKKDTLITTILIGNNVVNISVSALVTTFCIKYLGSSLVAYGTGILTILILIFGEVTPKQLAIIHSKGIAKAMAYPIFILTILLFPLVKAIQSIGTLISTLFSKDHKRGLTVEGLMKVVDVAEEDGVVDSYESDLLQRVLHFSENPIKTIMTHRNEVFLLSDSLTIDEAFPSIVSSHFSRIPIYCENHENITGIVLIRDILKYQLKKEGFKTLKQIARKPVFVPETKHVDFIFLFFKRSKMHMAIVLDEYGGFSGIITMEDVAEQLLGEIYDEHEISEGENIQSVPNKENTFKIQGETPYIQFCDEMDVSYDKSQKASTIAAYLMKITGDIPNENDIIQDNIGTYKILKMDERRIDQILFIKKDSE